MTDTYAAVFYLNTRAAPELRELADRAGVRDVVDERGTATRAFDRAHICGHWAGVGVHARLERHCLIILMSHQAFHRILVDSDERGEPAGEALLQAFRSACETLRPDLAMVCGSAADDLDRLVEEVHGAGLASVVARHLPLLFVPAEKNTTLGMGSERDSLETPAGLFIFAGQGIDRWF